MSVGSFEAVVRRAYSLAGEYRHEFVTLEHLLLALVEIDDLTNTLQAVGGDVKKLRADVKSYIEDPANHSVIKSGVYQPRHTALFITVIKKAKAQSLFSNKNDMGCMDILLAMFNIENSHASYFLYSAGFNKDALFNHLTRQKDDAQDMSEKDAIDILGQYCVNLNDKAAKGKIDPLIGRETEVENITQIMARRTKHNVIMLGDPGVGKTIIVEGLAKRIVEGDVPDILKNKTIYSLDIASIVAGTKFRGDFEERMKLILSAFASLPNAIMFIDEIHMIMGAGGGSQGAMDAANLLKPALSRGEIRCIGSTTMEEYRRHFEKDRALMRRFQKLTILEPSIEDAKRILQSISTYYSQYHGIPYSIAALDAAVELTARHMHDRFLPDKAIDIIDSAGARQNIKPQSERVSIIDLEQINAEVSRVANIQLHVNKEDELDKLAKLEDDLKTAVFGQDQAINKLADAVIISKSGLRDHHKTLGAFLFSGPTGVGKTEIAKQLAATLGIDFVRFDMSEFQERHSVSKFIGSPPGYVGYSDGSAGSGVLINSLQRAPHCVILCDEIEKAHPDIVNIFLQIMDNGMISSQDGKTASAKNCFLIFTSNLGASEMEKNSIGFGASSKEDAGKEAVKQWFAPEFRNRLDAAIEFGRLSKESMAKVLDKFIAQLNALSSSRNVSVVFDTRAKQWLIDRGFDKNMGARPLSRVIDEHVKRPISREMLFGQLKQGGAVIFSTDDNGLIYNIINTNLDITHIENDLEEINE